jgi:tetratricopeptide (TPR) repeat protein
MPRLAHVFTVFLAIASASAAHAGGKRERDKALALFEKSDRAYKAGKFEDAAKLLREAYALHPEPILLYNLGRAQEGLGDTRGAIDSYEQYLAQAKQIQDRGAIERRIETLKAQLAEEEARAGQLAEEEQRRKQAEAQRQKAEAERERAEAERQQAEAERLGAEQRARDDARSPVDRHGAWITIASGGALLVTATYFGIRASSTHDDAVAAPVQRDALALQQSAQRSATIANVLFVLGGITTAGGLGWKVYEWRSESSSAQLQVSPAGVALGGTW